MRQMGSGSKAKKKSGRRERTERRKNKREQQKKVQTVGGILKREERMERHEKRSSKTESQAYGWSSVAAILTEQSHEGASIERVSGGRQSSRLSRHARYLTRSIEKSHRRTASRSLAHIPPPPPSRRRRRRFRRSVRQANHAGLHSLPAQACLAHLVHSGSLTHLAAAARRRARARSGRARRCARRALGAGATRQRCSPTEARAAPPARQK
eukprot:1432330-Pleurochrysis_carterae.AAC.2